MTVAQSSGVHWIGTQSTESFDREGINLVDTRAERDLGPRVNRYIAVRAGGERAGLIGVQSEGCLASGSWRHPAQGSDWSQLCIQRRAQRDASAGCVAGALTVSSEPAIRALLDSATCPTLSTFDPTFEDAPSSDCPVPALDTVPTFTERGTTRLRSPSCNEPVAASATLRKLTPLASRMAKLPSGSAAQAA